MRFRYFDWRPSSRFLRVCTVLFIKLSSQLVIKEFMFTYQYVLQHIKVVFLTRQIVASIN